MLHPPERFFFYKLSHVTASCKPAVLIAMPTTEDEASSSASDDDDYDAAPPPHDDDVREATARRGLMNFGHGFFFDVFF